MKNFQSYVVYERGGYVSYGKCKHKYDVQGTRCRDTELSKRTDPFEQAIGSNSIREEKKTKDRIIAF